MALVQRLGHTIADLSRYVDGVKAMRANATYHKYVFWHKQAMDRHDHTDPFHGRSLAHGGPAFLPWHREFIWRFEMDLQQALGNRDAGLPYWNWALDKTDGQLPTSRVWSYLGERLGTVSLDGGNTTWTRMTARLEWDVWDLTTSHYESVDAPLGIPVRREFDLFSSPLSGHIENIRDLNGVNALTGLTTLDYDRAPWSSSNTSGFRSQTEGLFHDQVHLLVGGNSADMAVARWACNDPLFFLHHAMVDRLWARWQDAMVDSGTSLGDQYHPTMSEAEGIQFGHRLDEPMWPWSDRVEMERWGIDREDITPRNVLDTRSTRLNYVYDDQDPGGCFSVFGDVFNAIFHRSTSPKR